MGGVQKAPYGPHVATWHRLVQGAQGTMGIVTWASVRCELLPKAQEPFVVGSADLDSPAGDGRLAHQAADGQRVLRALRHRPGGHVRPGVAGGLRASAGRPAGLDPLLHGGRLRVLPRGAGERQRQGHRGPQPALGRGSRRSPSAGSPPATSSRRSSSPARNRTGSCATRAPARTSSSWPRSTRSRAWSAIMDGLAAKAGYPVADRGVYVQPTVQGTSCHCEFNLFYDPDDAGRGAAGQGTLAGRDQDPAWTTAPSSPGRTARAPA